MAKQLAFYFNANACSGCKACMAACKDKNDLPVGVNWRRVVDYGGGSWVQDANNLSLMLPSNVYAYSTSVACMHCQDAQCTEVCPAGAMTKRPDGIVVIDADKCIGCRYCEWACPYGAPQFDASRGVMTKCNFCEDLLAQGQHPACVDACVMRALDFGELDDLRARYGVVNATEPLPDSSFTSPSFVMTPHRHAQPSGIGAGEILVLPEEG
jgi:anaerobic dimethyl sulfoxide reductase subunit B (iron-sulfur subunit)